MFSHSLCVDLLAEIAGLLVGLAVEFTFMLAGLTNFCFGIANSNM